MKFKKIIALVPMRHHSQRVPGKNYRLLAGKPLYQHILSTLMSCKEISEIVVDTDSPEIISGIKAKFPRIKVIERPEHLRADDISMNEILLYDTSQYPADLYIQTHSTNPLVKPGTISKAIQTFIKNYPANDSMFAVTRLQVRLWDKQGRPINHNPEILLQTQDLPSVYEENSCFYIFTRSTLESRCNRLGEHPYLYEIDRSEAWDIDEEDDFLIIDLLLSHRIKNESTKNR
jgi:CMP-N-acetylneuraminic acid synthetase